MKVEQKLRALKRQLAAVRWLDVTDASTRVYLDLLETEAKVAELRAQLLADAAEARASRDRRRADNLRALAGA